MRKVKGLRRVKAESQPLILPSALHMWHSDIVTSADMTLKRKNHHHLRTLSRLDAAVRVSGKLCAGHAVFKGEYANLRIKLHKQCRIDPNVRKDRRCFWLAAIGIQTRWRMLPKRAYYRLLKIEVKRVQTHFRMWSDRRVFLFFKEKVYKNTASYSLERAKFAFFDD